MVSLIEFGMHMCAFIFAYTALFIYVLTYHCIYFSIAWVSIPCGCFLLQYEISCKHIFFMQYAVILWFILAFPLTLNILYRLFLIASTLQQLCDSSTHTKIDSEMPLWITIRMHCKAQLFSWMQNNSHRHSLHSSNPRCRNKLNRVFRSKETLISAINYLLWELCLF